MQAFAAEPAWHRELENIRRRMTARVTSTIGVSGTAYFIVRHNHEVVGVSGVATSHWTDQHLLTGICVLPSAQRRGLGSLLLWASLSWLKHSGLTTAQVYTENGSVADRRLYPRFGAVREPDVHYPGIALTNPVPPDIA